jgi:16S rRNA C967 or C1407 C5-methylase (RsmB/RsmF family)
MPPSTRSSIDWPKVLGPILCLDPTPTVGAISADELEALDETLNSYPRRAIRPRPTIPLSELPFASEPVRWFPPGRFVHDTVGQQPVRPGAYLQHAARDYYIQDAGSMLALALCDVQPGQWVCDTCAAPGGKSGGLSETLAGHGMLLANEVIRSRLSILNLALARTGHANHVITNLEIEALAQLCGAAFDCVLVDAPCTGQALVSRGKQSLAAFGVAQIDHSRQRQQRILRAAAGLVKPLGRLVYSTCAFSFAENEQVVLDFLQEQPGWRLGIQPSLAAWNSPVLEGCYRVWPHRDGCGGAFAALLLKTDDTPAPAVEHVPAGRRDSHSRSTYSHSPHSHSRQSWERQAALPSGIHWLAPHDTGQFWRTGNCIHRFAPHIPTAWIESAVAGTALAECPTARQVSAHGSAHSPAHHSSHLSASTARWIPCFDAALLATELSPIESLTAGLGSQTLCTEAPPQPTCNLDDAQAVQYVLGQAVRVATGPEDWCVVTWRDRRLSWGKVSQGVLKNHFPKPLRQQAIVATPNP